MYRIGGSAVSSIDDIGNVTAASPANGTTLVYNGNQWVPGAVIGGTSAYTTAAAVIPFDGNTNVTAGTLVAQGFTGTVNVSGSVTYDTTTKVLGSSSIYGAIFANAGVYYGSSVLRSFLASNSFTIEFWFRAYQNVNTGWIFGLQDSTGSVEYLALKSGNGSASPYARAVLYSGGTTLSNSSLSNISYNTWYHVAFTHDVLTKQVKFFFGGTLVATTTAVPALSSDNLGLAITAKWNGSSFTGGYQQNIDYLVVTPGLKYTESYTPVAVEQGAYISYNLSGLDDVTSTAPTSGQALVWNSGTSSWGPGTIDEVLEYANLAAFPATGESGKIYVTIDTKLIYRWTGSAYVSLASGSISGAGDAAISTTPGQGASLIYLDGKWRIGPVLGPKNTTTDPQWDNVKLLLKGNGSDNGTTFTDYSTTNAQFLKTGTTITSTAQSIYSGSSIRFGYQGYTGTNNSLYLTSGNFQGTVFPSTAQNCTIEAWIYIDDTATNTTGSTELKYIWAVWGQATGGNFQYNPNLYLSRANGASNWDLYYHYVYQASNNTNSTAVSLTQYAWHHIAVVRTNGSNTRLYVDGVQGPIIGTSGNNSVPFASGAGTFSIGAATSSSTYNANNFRGYIEDFRVTHNTARYTNPTYTVPAATLPIAGDTNPSITYPVSAHDDVSDIAASANQILVWNATLKLWEPSSDYIQKSVLKTEVAASTDFANFQTRIAAL